MAFPWNVRGSPLQKKGAWLYFSLIMALYVTYCIVVTVQAFRARSSPPVSLKYNKHTPITLPDISFDISVSEPNFIQYVTCQVYPFNKPLRQVWNQSHTPYLFHASNPEQSWDGELWSGRPLQVGPDFLPQLVYRPDTDSICQVSYNYSKISDPSIMTITYQLSQIAYHGGYTEDNIMNLEFVTQETIAANINVLIGVILGQGPAIATFTINEYSFNQLILSPVTVTPLGRKSTSFFKSVSLNKGLEYSGQQFTTALTSRTVSFLTLDPQGALHQEEIDPVSLTTLLAKYGGVWFFVPLLFGLIYVAIINEAMLECISLGWFKQILASFCQREGPVRLPLHAALDFESVSMELGTVIIPEPKN